MEEESDEYESDQDYKSNKKQSSPKHKNSSPKHKNSKQRNQELNYQSDPDMNNEHESSISKSNANQNVKTIGSNRKLVRPMSPNKMQQTTMNLSIDQYGYSKNYQGYNTSINSE